MRPKAALHLLGQAFLEWRRDNPSLLAAGLSYFAAFSIVPFIILAAAITGSVLGDEAAEGLLAARLTGVMGSQAALAVQSLVIDARHAGMGTATALSLVLLFITSSQVFQQLQTALNVIWGMPPPPGAPLVLNPLVLLHEAKQMVIKRLLSFAMVILTGAVLFASFFLDAAIGIVQSYLSDMNSPLVRAMPSEFVSLGVSFLLIMIMTAFIYKVLPDTRIAWSDVWIGAALTSFLLTIGRFAIGLYFQMSNVGSVYGVAGSLVVVMVGIFISAQVFLFGAEFTEVFCRDRGSRRGKRRRARRVEVIPAVPRSGSSARS